MMKKLLFRTLLVIALAAPLPATFARAESGDGWTAVAVGVDYQKWTLDDPNQVYVTRMQRDNPGVTLESAVGSGELATGRETVSDMANRYNDSLSAWGGTWGLRDQVVSAINGDYFNPASGYPQNGMVHSGWYDKRYNDFEGWSGFVWTSDRDPFIGDCVKNDLSRQYITFADGSTTQTIDDLNTPRPAGHLVLYTPDYASSTGTDNSGVEVVVVVTQPLSVIPGPRMQKGTVAQIRDQDGSTPIGFDQVILSATGPARDKLLANIHLGDSIGFTQEVTALDTNCNYTNGPDWTNAYAAIGGAFMFLRDGAPQHLDVSGATARNPRTAIAFDDQYIYFIVVDGRQPGVSIGMSLDELAGFSKEVLGAKWGVAQDGGGSSTMVINGSTVNVPSDQCKSIYLPKVNKLEKAPVYGPGTVETAEVFNLNPSPLCERPVANGMMMVALQPQDNSTTFVVGDTPMTLSPTELRLGPGTNYAPLLTIPIHQQVTVQQHGNGLDGIRAKGTNWWYVTYTDAAGWVPESNLVEEPHQLPADGQASLIPTVTATPETVQPVETAVVSTPTTEVLVNQTVGLTIYLPQIIASGSASPQTTQQLLFIIEHDQPR
jgi:hypothetical protein